MITHQQNGSVLTYDLLENASSRNSPLVQRLCFEVVGHLASNPLYRSFQLLQAIECVVALVALPVVHYKFLVHSALHINLKALLSLYFHIAFAYILTVLTCLIYEAVLWITHRTPCDIIPLRPVYTFYTITEVYFLMHMLGLQLVMTVERAIATVYVDTYESWKGRSAIYFIAATFVIPGAMILYFYKGATFTEPNLHSFTDQSTVKDRISEGSVLVILLSVVCVVVQRILSMVNRKRRIRLITKPLTTRYQLSENIAGTSLSASLQTLQVVASVLYAVLTLVCSELHLGMAANERDTNLLTKEGCYIIPLAVAILPFLTLHLLKKRQRIRSNSIQQSVFRSKSDDVMAVYATMLKKQWG